MDKRTSRFANQKQERLGEIKRNCKGDLMKIVEYNSSTNIVVEFQDEFHYQVKTSYKYFSKGEITNLFGKHICNMGYIGNTKTSVNGKTKKSYDIWNSMIHRCYDEKVHTKRPTYKECIVCDEWLCYANFEKWYNENYYEVDGEKMCLDKDILVKGNKVYSPKTCRIVPNEINVLFTKSDKNRGSYPIGVTYNEKRHKYLAQISKLINGKKHKIIIGSFFNMDDAFKAYKQAKEIYIKEIADKYKQYISNDIYIAMYNYQVEITD